ncbi:hypothetical protein [Streptomyces sp. CBMA152]|uniref:hypothetical protein n=1 Tax=Streptomyces sp. CBMA152 TaxID=1896312 RepID=UPI0016613FCA|nr:hypothetical protein [Streptomyces sp. CBMA152]
MQGDRGRRWLAAPGWTGLAVCRRLVDLTAYDDLHHGMVPPTCNFTRLDQDLSINVVHGRPFKLEGEQVVAVKNSAGFGGHNVALTFRGVPAGRCQPESR